jgi:hypothetical protein
MAGDSGSDPMAAVAALNQANNVQAKTPPWMQGVGAQTMPQAMPGQLEAIAAQLAGGYSAPNAAAQKTGTAGFMKHLDQVYDPVRSMNFAPGTKTTAKPTAVTQAPGKYSNPRFSGGRWIVTKDGVDMAFNPDAYHAGKGFIPIGGNSAANSAARPNSAAPVWNPLQGQRPGYSSMAGDNGQVIQTRRLR